MKCLGDIRHIVPLRGRTPTPGDEPNDGGGDLLVVDPKSVHHYRAHSACKPETALLAAAEHDGHGGHRSWVSLERFNADFSRRAMRDCGCSGGRKELTWTLRPPGCGRAVERWPRAVRPKVARCRGGSQGTRSRLSAAPSSWLTRLFGHRWSSTRFAVALDLGAPLSWVAAHGRMRIPSSGSPTETPEGRRSDVAYALDLTTGTRRAPRRWRGIRPRRRGMLAGLRRPLLRRGCASQRAPRLEGQRRSPRRAGEPDR